MSSRPGSPLVQQRQCQERDSCVVLTTTRPAVPADSLQPGQAVAHRQRATRGAQRSVKSKDVLVGQSQRSPAPVALRLQWQPKCDGARFERASSDEAIAARRASKGNRRVAAERAEPKREGGESVSVGSGGDALRVAWARQANQEKVRAAHPRTKV